MASFSSVGRGRRPLLRSLDPYLSTTAFPASSSAGTSSSPPLSPSAAKSRLRKEYDPDKALAIISSLSGSFNSTTSGRFAVELAARRLARARRFSEVESLLESRKSDSAASDEPFLSTVILCYGSAQMLDRAISTFHDVPRLCSSPPTTISFNALLSAAIRAKKSHQVPVLFDELSEKYSISPDKLSYGILVKALCLSGKLENALQVTRDMEEKGIEVTTVTYTTLIDSYYKLDKVEKAEELWNEMVEKGCSPDLASYNVKIMHQSLKGKPEDVLETIAKLKAVPLKPDAITYTSLMACYSRHGRSEDVRQVYEGLKANRCDPNSTTFKVMINHLCEVGDFNAGFDIFKESMKHNKIPDFRTMKPLVVGLAKNSKFEDAKMVIRVVRQRFPANMVGGWKAVEKELVLHLHEQASNEIESTKS